MNAPDPAAGIERIVELALAEDVGAGDLTAELIPAAATATATVICREAAVLCGRDWFDATFARLSAAVEIDWRKQDSAELRAGEVVCDLRGPTRALLTGERAALNFLQLLSSTATATRRALEAIGGGKGGKAKGKAKAAATLLDTRKTIPGLRQAQKYAVRCGGAENHRMGLYDGILIKENHIKAAAGIENAVRQARTLAPRKIEVEVKSLQELAQALRAGADIVMLDNFPPEDITEAIQQTAGRAPLEVSGNIDRQDLATLAATGIDYISLGALTKNIKAVDFSMLIE